MEHQHPCGVNLPGPLEAVSLCRPVWRDVPFYLPATDLSGTAAEGPPLSPMNVPEIVAPKMAAPYKVHERESEDSRCRA